jgi:RNA polymerase sigma-70 factor (ECF subfamily)
MRDGATNELLQRAQSGDHAAFEQIATLMVRRLYATASLIVRDTDAASDAVQETLIEVWRNLAALRDLDSFEAWTRRILVRRCYRAADANRRRRVEVRVLEVDEPTASHEAWIGESDALARAFGRLSPEHRAVLVLHHRNGLELTETADALGIPLGTVKSRLNRATVALRAALDAENRGTSALGSQTA